MPTKGTLKNQAKNIVSALAEAYPEVTCALNFEDPWQCMVSTILSAQCTDKKVNQVTPALFEKYPDPESTAKARIPSIEKIIKPIGLYRGKAKNIKASAEQVLRDFGGKVPKTIDNLVTLPGVGRKTANCVLVNAWGQPGIMVDTHCTRVTRRLGLHEEENPDKIERILKELILEKDQADTSHRIIIHGRQVCKARKPQCEDCPLLRLCPTGKKNVRSK